MAQEIVIEAGTISLLHTGMQGSIGQSQKFDPSRVGMFVFNDAADVQYQVESGPDREVITPRPAKENCVVLACTPDVDEQRRALCYPRRVFSFEDADHTWPSYHFRMAGVEGLTGPFDTAFVLLGADFTWKNTLVAGLPTTHVHLPVGSVVCQVIRGTQEDEVRPVLPGKPIDRIVLKLQSGGQQSHGGDPFPP